MRHLAKHFLVIAFVTTLSAWSFAHERRDASKSEAYRSGYEQGYRDGFHHGEEDFRDRLDFDPESEEFKKADRGYQKSLKHKDEYKRGYREAYRLGYEEGYEGRGFGDRSDRIGDRYPSRRSRFPGRNGDSRFDTAFEMGSRQGLQDGLQKGEEDRRRNRSYDVDRHDWYDDADRGYRSSYGDKDDYRAGYRRGFEEGYDEGYGRSSRDRRNRNSRGGSVWDRIFGRWP